MGNRRITPRDPAIGGEALAALRDAKLGHDHVDLGHRRLSSAAFDEVRSVLRQLGAEWHAGRKLFTFTARWSAERLHVVQALGVRPTGEDFPHRAELDVEIDGEIVKKEYRWRVEIFDGRPRVVGQHRPIGAAKWSELRNPDRLALLLARTPELDTGARAEQDTRYVR